MGLRRVISFSVLAWGIFARAQQPDFSKVEVRATHVAGGVHMIQGEGGNIAVSAGADGLLMVDNEFLPLAEKIEAAMRPLSPGKLKFVVNTHHHGDHTGGNVHFGAQVPIVAHENVRKRLRVVPASTQAAGVPVLTFENSMSVHFNGEEVKIVHVPNGHTDGDSFIFFTKSNVVHMGDQFFCGRFPNIDLGGGGDVRGYIRNVERALEWIPSDAKIIPGHGPLGTVKELREFREMLVGTANFVEQEVRAAKRLDQVKAAGLPERWKNWDQQPIREGRWIDILYRGLSPKPDGAGPKPSVSGGAPR